MKTEREHFESYLLAWDRWEDYDVTRDGWFYPVGARTTYDPTQEAALPTELQRVHQAINAASGRASQERAKVGMAAWHRPMISFLCQFGFLGQTHLEGKPRKVVLEGKRQFIDGDHHVWLLAHAQNVDLCLSLAGAVHIQDSRELARRFTYIEETMPKEFPGLPFSIPTLTNAYKEIDIRAFQEDAKKKGLQELGKAKEFLALLLAPNLGAIQRVYDGQTGRSAFRFQALIQLIYWQIADWANGEQLRRCPECQAYFFAHDARQKFCPPTSVARERGAKESRCSKRYRKRALRSKS